MDTEVWVHATTLRQVASALPLVQSLVPPRALPDKHVQLIQMESPDCDRK